MTQDDLTTLRERSDQLADDDLDGAVEVYEAILRLEEGDVLATRGLVLALEQLGELDRADEIVQEALVMHPGDETLLRRADGIARRRKWLVKEAKSPTSRRRSGSARASATWIKAVHYDGDGWDLKPGDETWLSDPGQRDASGERLYTGAGEPWGRPSWRVGEQAGIYLGGVQRVPLLVEITKAPSFEPDFVQAASWAKEGDGERWPWVTHVRVLKAAPVDAAPTLDDLGIASSSMQQRARLRTDAEIHAKLAGALDAG